MAKRGPARTTLEGDLANPRRGAQTQATTKRRAAALVPNATRKARLPATQTKRSHLDLMSVAGIRDDDPGTLASPDRLQLAANGAYHRPDLPGVRGRVCQLGGDHDLTLRGRGL
jgi:hypothetical protein